MAGGVGILCYGNACGVINPKAKERNMEMTSKEFNLLIAMILEMLKDGQVDKVIKLLEETKNNPDK